MGVFREDFNLCAVGRDAGTLDGLGGAEAAEDVAHAGEVV